MHGNRNPFARSGNNTALIIGLAVAALAVVIGIVIIAALAASGHSASSATTDRSVCSKMAAAYARDPSFNGGVAYLTVEEGYEQTGLTLADAFDVVDNSLRAYCPQWAYVITETG
jgi:hypothetical protein